MQLCTVTLTVQYTQHWLVTEYSTLSTAPYALDSPPLSVSVPTLFGGLCSVVLAGQHMETMLYHQWLRTDSDYEYDYDYKYDG